MDWDELKQILPQIAKERGIPLEKVLESFELALASAYRKEYGKKDQKILAQLDWQKGEIQFWQVFTVVDDDFLKDKEIVFNPERHIFIKEAKKIKENVKVGDEIKIPMEKKESYGRIAAQTAKQVILQRLREAEKDVLWEEFLAKEGEIVAGIVQKVDKKNVVFDLGRTQGFLPKEEQIPGEFYRPGQRLKAIVLKVEKTKRGPKITLSRSFPKFVSKLFEMEVPELSQGQIKIVSIAREAGSRTKIAVQSLDERIDPIGAMVGQRGSRISAVISELGGEKIDVIKYSEKPEEYVANSLSPAKVLEVTIKDKNTAEILVSPDQLSLAIGKDGQNVRLAVKLTGWKIDVKSKEELE